MPEQVEKRVEYRVVGKRDGSLWTGPTRRDLSLAEADLTKWQLPYSRVRIQHRTVETTPWEDVADV